PVAVQLCGHHPDAGANPRIRSNPYTTSLDATVSPRLPSFLPALSRLSFHLALLLTLHLSPDADQTSRATTHALPALPRHVGTADQNLVAPATSSNNPTLSSNHRPGHQLAKGKLSQPLRQLTGIGQH
ncbi:hypothetical protein, partial [Streptomyces sp. NPDC057623]|uniref:hypothetical protein n=1 Tax=Streptomyces sp. NPDC057623 TaxID=3346187 RepID=UPI0036AEFB50